MKQRIISLTAAVMLALSTLAATLETDRTWYLAGEALTVSVTASNARIAYAELCDTHGLAAGVAIVLQEHTAPDGHIDGHVGRGVIELPADLHSGYYVLSVYTSHDSYATQRLVPIVNPLRKSQDDDISWVAGDSCRATADGTAELVSEKVAHGRELEGHIVRAHVTNVADGHTYRARAIRPTLSIIGKQIHYFEGQMVDDTTAVFNTYGVEGHQTMVLAATTSTTDDQEADNRRPLVPLPIEVISPYAALVPKQLPHLTFHYKRNEVEARSLDMQRRQLESPSSKDSSLLTPPSSKELFGMRPDLSYNLDEYRQFLTVREVVREYVMCVTKATIKGVPRLIVRAGHDLYDNSWPALVLIDGMPVSDTERLLNYDARRIHYINVYSNKYTFGNGTYNGVLSFVTRTGLLTNYPVERNMQYVEYDFPK